MKHSLMQDSCPCLDCTRARFELRTSIIAIAAIMTLAFAALIAWWPFP